MWYLSDILSATKSIYTLKHKVIRYQPESSKRTFLSFPLPSPITRYYLEWNKTSNPINPEKNKIRTPIYPNLCYRLTSYNGSPPNTNCNLIRTNPSSKLRGQSSYSSLYQTSPEKISFTPFVMFFLDTATVGEKVLGKWESLSWFSCSLSFLGYVFGVLVCVLCVWVCWFLAGIREERGRHESDRCELKYNETIAFSLISSTRLSRFRKIKNGPF